MSCLSILTTLQCARNEVRREATKAAMSAKASAIAAAPVVGIAEALVDRFRKVAHQITR